MECSCKSGEIVCFVSDGTILDVPECQVATVVRSMGPGFVIGVKSPEYIYMC